MEILAFLATFLILDIAALRFGANSSDGLNSPERERRQKWFGERH